MPIRAVDPGKRAGGHPTIAGPRSAGPRAAGPIPAPAPRARPTLAASGSKPHATKLPGDDAPVAPLGRHPGSAGNQQPRTQKRAQHKVDRTGPNWDENGDYIVGKGRPPKAPQWKTGQSGNPDGPKKRERLDPQAAFDKEILADFTAKVNGADVTLNMGTFAIQLLKANAAKGTVKAQQMLLELFMATVRKMGANDDTPEIEEWEQAIFDEIIANSNLPAKPVIRRTDRSANGEDDAP